MCVVFNSLAQDLATVGRRLSDLVLGSVPRLSHLLVHLFRLTITWHGLRLTYHAVGIVLSAHEPLPSSRMALPGSTWNIGGWLFIHLLKLLRVVTIEKVHARVCLALIYRQVLRVPHFIGLARLTRI